MRSSRVYTTEGIILKRRNVGEADRTLTVFTKQYGKIRVIAKGVRKVSSRRAGHLEVFTHVLLTLHSRPHWDIVTEAQSISRDEVFSRDLGRMGYAYCLCELVDQLLADHQEQEDVYHLLADGLDELTQKELPQDWQEILTDFVHNLLWILGFLPREQYLKESRIQPFVERITERRLRTWPLMSGILST